MLPDRIVILNDLSHAAGGASALAIGSALAFAQRGHPVTLLTGDHGHAPDISDAGIELISLGKERLLASPRRDAARAGLFNKSSYNMISQWISDNDNNRTVYHLHGWSQILSPAVFSALNPVRDRLVISAHDFFLACPNGAFADLKTGEICNRKPLGISCLTTNCDRRSYSHKLWRVGRQLIMRHYLRPAESPPIIAIHNRMRRFLVKSGIPETTIVTIPNPITPFTSTRIEAENNQELLFVGRLDYTKGPDLALAAARKAKAILRLVGDGPMRSQLERQYPEMLFTGRQEPSQIGEHARRARMLLMPSRYPEPYGLAAAEALWSGLPVIAPASAFLTDDILAAKAGLACEPRDSTLFAEEISRLMASDQTVKQMSLNAFSKLSSIALTWQTWPDRLFSMYEKRLASRDDAISQPEA